MSNEEAIVSWDEELAAMAKMAAGMEESTSTLNFFSLKSGVLAWNDATIPGNTMAVVVIDHVLENIYYEGEYDPNTPQSPLCFAFGRKEDDMSPHSVCKDRGTAQNEMCKNCDHNRWGSADKGKGKACGNVRRLAIIPAGTFDAKGSFIPFDDIKKFEDDAIGYMKLPVMSVKNYSTYVKQLDGAFHLPPLAFFTKVWLTPDAKSQFRVNFANLGKIPSEFMGVIIQRHKEAAAVIESPYTPVEAPSEEEMVEKLAKSKKKRKY